MTVAQWPVLLPQKPLKDGYSGDPHKPLPRAEMEQGGVRKRRNNGASPATVALSWRMTAAEFTEFAGFYHFALVEGTGWFTVPVWAGDGMATVEAQFADRYRVRPRGPLAVTVTTSLTLRALPTMTAAEATAFLQINASGMPKWPDLLPEVSLQEGTEIDPHQPVLMTDLDGGPGAKRAPFPNSPGTIQMRWRMTASEFAAFKGFYRWHLRDGAAWFEMPLWVASGYERIAAQFSDRYSFAPAGARDVLVTGELTIRQLPIQQTGAGLLLSMLGEAAFTGLVADIHQIVHVDYPEAV